MVEEMNAQESNKALYISLAVLAFLTVALLTNGFGLFTAYVPKNTIPLAIGNSPVLGNPDAPVIIYEFSDFSCPYCAAAAGYNQKAQNALKSKISGWEAPIPKIREEYVKTGKVKIVFKYLPGHGGARTAHEVALALNEQGLFWEFSDKVFEKQENLNNLAEMKKIARELGADMPKLENALSSGKYLYQLGDDTSMGESQGILGTPAFIIDGKLVEGAESFSVFKKIIDSELNK